MSENTVRSGVAKLRVRRAFTGFWVGLFALAIGWTASVAVAFFTTLARGEGTAIWGMEVVMHDNKAFEMSFSGPQVLSLLIGGALLGTIVALVLPANRRHR